MQTHRSETACSASDDSSEKATQLESALVRLYRNELDGAGSYLDLARALERSCFEYMIIKDGPFIADAYKGSSEWYLRNAYSVPKSGQFPLVPLLGYVTKRLGSWQPSPPAFTRRFSRPGWAPHWIISHGRVGLNIVAANNDRAAQSFGLDHHYEHDLRYEMADKWMEVVNRLRASWEPEVVVANPDADVFADRTKIHPIDFEGRFYKSRGLLNTASGPQGRPVHLRRRR